MTPGFYYFSENKLSCNVLKIGNTQTKDGISFLKETAQEGLKLLP
jgi:hypothetical protein